LEKAEALAEKFQNNGFAEAHIIGEFSGRLMNLENARALQASWEATASQMN